MDLAQHIVGARIVAVMADLATIHPSRLRPSADPETFQASAADGSTERVAVDSEDFASVLVRFANGARGSFTVSQVSAGRKNRLSLEVDATQGSLAWCSEESEWLWLGSRTEASRVAQRSAAAPLVPGLSRLPAGHAEGWSDALTNVILGFYDQIASGSAGPGSPPSRTGSTTPASSTRSWRAAAPSAGSPSSARNASIDLTAT